MKKIIYTIFAVCAAAIVSGCQKDTVEINSPMVGEWHLDSWLSEEQKDFDVYLSFSKDGTFEMFSSPEHIPYQGMSCPESTATGWNGAHRTHSHSPTGTMS